MPHPLSQSPSERFKDPSFSSSGTLREEEESMFRRRPRAPRRRKARKGRAWFRAGLRVALLLGAWGILAYWALASEVFVLRSFEWDGNQRIEDAWIREQLEPWRGENLVTLPLAEVQNLLQQHPWSKAVLVRRELPSELRLEVVEHKPAAWLEVAENTFVVSGDGEIVAETRSSSEDLLRIRHDGLSSVPDTLLGQKPREVMTALNLAKGLTSLEVSKEAHLREVVVLGWDDYELQWTAVPFEVLVRDGFVQEEISVFFRLLERIRGGYESIEAVDLRIPGRIVLRGAQAMTPPLDEILAGVESSVAISEPRQRPHDV